MQFSCQPMLHYPIGIVLSERTYISFVLFIFVVVVDVVRAAIEVVVL